MKLFRCCFFDVLKLYVNWISYQLVTDNHHSVIILDNPSLTLTMGRIQKLKYHTHQLSFGVIEEGHSGLFSLRPQ